MSSQRKPVGIRKGLKRSEEEVDKVLGSMSASSEADAEMQALSGSRSLSSAADLQMQQKKAEQEKERVTHYLSKSTLEELENIYDELRRSMPYKLKTKVKKSHLVEFALDTMVREYNRLGRDSALGKMIEDIRRENS